MRRDASRCDTLEPFSFLLVNQSDFFLEISDLRASDDDSSSSADMIIRSVALTLSNSSVVNSVFPANPIVWLI